MVCQSGMELHNLLIRVKADLLSPAKSVITVLTTVLYLCVYLFSGVFHLLVLLIEYNTLGSRYSLWYMVNQQMNV